MKLGGVGDQASAPIASLPIAPALATLFEAFRAGRSCTFTYRGRDAHASSRGGSRRSAATGTSSASTATATRCARSAPTASTATSRSASRDAFDAARRLPRPTTTSRTAAWLLGDAPPVTVRLAVDADHVDGVLGELGADARVDDRRADGDTVVEVTVTNRAAFRSFVLGFLEHAEVLEPPDVRADDRRLARDASRPVRA